MRTLIYGITASLLVACAQPGPKTDSGATARESANAETASQDGVLDHINYTPFNTTLLTGRCSNDECLSVVEYYSWQAKLSFDIDAKGQLKISDRQEPTLDTRDDPEDDYKCGVKDGTFNQRTTWFPYTAIFVRGGKLQSVHKSDGEKQEMLPLSPVEQGLAMVVGKGARKVEYAYVPCVGKYRVPVGHRLSTFLPRNSVLSIKPAKGTPLRLSLPDPTEPYVLLRYESGEMAPIPMRITMLTVDVLERRVTAHYRTTFPMSPPIRRAELRAILPHQAPDADETPGRFRERTDATLRYLKQCAQALRPMEPCASTTVRPDPKIFSP